MPYLDKVWIYPVKSLDGVAVETAMVLPGGALKGDRQYAIVDAEGKVVNAKRTAEIQKLRATFNGFENGSASVAEQVTLQLGESTQTFDLKAGQSPLTDWLSDYFGYAVSLQQDDHMGFPDDRMASGPTLVSQKTLETVAGWFDLSLAETRRRFRTNLEVADAIAFWEDSLLASAGELFPFTVGSVTFLGSNPCARCIVPTRDALTGDRTTHFQKTFIQHRQASLTGSNPGSNPLVRSRFDHFYRLTLNTQVSASETGKSIQIGDPVQIPRN
jgi:uncharacterized protein